MDQEQSGNGALTQSDMAQPAGSVSYGAVNPKAASVDQQRLIPNKVMPDGSVAYTEINEQGMQLLATKLTDGTTQTIFTAKARYTDMSMLAVNLDTADQALLVYHVPNGGAAGTSNTVEKTTVPSPGSWMGYDFGMNPGETLVVNGGASKFSVTLHGRLCK